MDQGRQTWSIAWFGERIRRSTRRELEDLAFIEGRSTTDAGVLRRPLYAERDKNGLTRPGIDASRIA